MSTCKDCLHYEVCGGFTPTDLDADVFDYCRKGNTDEIPDIEERCGSFKNKADYAPVVFCDECKHKEVLVPSTAIWCNKHKIYIKPQPTDFCSYGERKGAE